MFRGGWLWLCLVLAVAPAWGALPPEEPVQAFVVQLTRAAGDNGHRRALLQIDRVLDDVGEHRVHFEVIAYEEGILALLNDNQQTVHLLTKLAQRGVVFKACRISMRGWQLTEDDFPLEVEYVEAGTPEMIRRRLQGYQYWLP